MSILLLQLIDYGFRSKDLAACNVLTYAGPPEDMILKSELERRGRGKGTSKLDQVIQIFSLNVAISCSLSIIVSSSS